MAQVFVYSEVNNYPFNQYVSITNYFGIAIFLKYLLPFFVIIAGIPAILSITMTVAVAPVSRAGQSTWGIDINCYNCWYPGDIIRSYDRSRSPGIQDWMVDLRDIIGKLNIFIWRDLGKTLPKTEMKTENGGENWPGIRKLCRTTKVWQKKIRQVKMTRRNHFSAPCTLWVKIRYSLFVAYSGYSVRSWSIHISAIASLKQDKINQSTPN